MDLGLMIADVPRDMPARTKLDLVLRQAEAAQRNGLTYIAMGQHFLYGDVTYLQPVPVLARLSAELDPGIKIVTLVMLLGLQHPVVVAEELATLDLVSQGRLIVGVGTGFRAEEFAHLGVPRQERVPRLIEAVELIKELWTKDRVDSPGGFFPIDGAEPHIRPWQSPHPPIWVGASGDRGIRLAARLGDAWPLTPRLSADDAIVKLARYRDERVRLGLPLGYQPIRRDVVFGSDRADALRRFATVAADRYGVFARQGLPGQRGPGGGSGFETYAASHVIHGSDDDCVDQLRQLAGLLPVNPVIVRAHWPGDTVQDSVELLDRLGRAVVPAVRDVVAVDPTSWSRHPSSGS